MRGGRIRPLSPASMRRRFHAFRGLVRYARARASPILSGARHFSRFPLFWAFISAKTQKNGPPAGGPFSLPFCKFGVERRTPANGALRFSLASAFCAPYLLLRVLDCQSRLLPRRERGAAFPTNVDFLPARKAFNSACAPFPFSWQYLANRPRAGGKRAERIRPRRGTASQPPRAHFIRIPRGRLPPIPSRPFPRRRFRRIFPRMSVRRWPSFQLNPCWRRPSPAA